MRSIKELLILMKDHINLLKSGLCRLHSDMYSLGIINYDEHLLIKRFIFASTSLGINTTSLWFEIGDANHRILWLDSKINTLH